MCALTAIHIKKISLKYIWKDQKFRNDQKCKNVYKVHKQNTKDSCVKTKEERKPMSKMQITKY